MIKGKCPDCKTPINADSIADIRCPKCGWPKSQAKSGDKGMSTLKRENLNKGRREDCLNSKGQPIYFASRWEANYWRYLAWLKTKGEIRDFVFQPVEFDFSEWVKHGTNRYRLDFCVTELNGSVYYIEIKGYMDAKSKTKIKRLAKYYPEVVMKIVNGKDYLALEKQVGAMVPGWEWPQRK